MKKFRFKSLICAVAALILAVPTVSVPAFANSGPPWEEGVTNTGVHCVHENSVLEVQGETLTFDIATLPFEMQEGEKYHANVTAEYVFKNPTAETVNTKMAFPIGLMPNYQIDKDKLQPIENPIKVNGQPVDYTVRHTYGTFDDFANDVKKIKDDYIQTDFFTLDLPVTEYVLQANLEKRYDYALFKAKMPQSDKTRYLGSADSQGYFNYLLEDGEKISIYVLGEDIDLSTLEWSATHYNEFLGRHTAVNGSVSYVKKAVPITFKEYALRNYDKNGKISDVDWYNGIFEYINTDALCAGSNAQLFENDFTEWYVYETSVGANGTFTNSVTARLYPRIYYDYEPDVYEYSYFLSPAKEWATFGNLTVNINTKHYLQNNEYYDPDEAVNKFTKTENGYTATFEALPDTELRFSLCSVETPSRRHVGTAIPTALVIVLGVLFIGCPVILGIGALITFLVIVVRRKKKASSPSSAQKATGSPDQTTVLSPAQTTSPQIAVSADIDDGITESREEGTDGRDETAVSQEASQAEEEAAAAEDGTTYCVYCGNRLDGGARFCTSCGRAVHNQANQPNNYAPSYVPTQNGGKKVNGLGIAGFVVSLVAWLFVELWTGFAFLLTAVAFGLSLAGLLLRRKYEKVYGFAIAGLVISSLMLLLVVIGIFLGLLIIIGFMV